MSGESGRLDVVSAKLINNSFEEISEVEEFLSEQNLSYRLTREKENFAKTNPKDGAISWSEDQPMYYLVINTVSKKKLYRFTLYPTEDGIYIEEDFGYKNPYQ